MGLIGDKKRLDEIGEETREDLSEYIKHGELEFKDGKIRVPIKVVDLPKFEYQPGQMGGVGQGQGGQPQPGQPVGPPQPAPGEDGDPGEDPGEHGYYEIDPEKFAEALEDELNLPELEPKGKQVKEYTEGDFNESSRTGPETLRDMDFWYRQNYKRNVAEANAAGRQFLTAALMTSGYGPERVKSLRDEKQIRASDEWIEKKAEQMEPDNRTAYDDIDEVERKFGGRVLSVRNVAKNLGKGDMQFQDRREDRRYRDAERIPEYEKNVVVVNIRDVSGSMGQTKRELVENTFTPLDWYLTGKYDNAEFVYIAHDAEAWEVEREEFFGIKSGGGTRISTAYELAKEILDKEYPWSEWNRYVFAAGDGENSSNDTNQQVIPYIDEIDANLHAYVQVGDSQRGRHGPELEDAMDGGDLADHDNVVVTYVKSPDDVKDAIYDILSTEAEE